MELQIVKSDHHGRGIGYLNEKIVFVDNALPGEIVEVNIDKENSKFILASAIDYISKSPRRVKSKCPNYPLCGGCQLRSMNYEDTLEFKRNKVSEILKKYAGLNVDIKMFKSEKKDFYRNKIELKVRNGHVGFYKNGTHEIVEVDRCLNAEETINSFLLNFDLLHLENGDITIKANYNGEILIVVNTSEKCNSDIEALREKNKLVGIVWNDKLVFGVDHFIEIIDNLFFKESYDSFFQINREITKILFNLLKENIEADYTVLDLCCGVGTLSIIASEKAKKVYGIEVVENSIKDALLNARMNRRENIDFILGDAFTGIEKIADTIDEIIIDPPRCGLNDIAIKSILQRNVKKIIYISCNPMTLARDLKLLTDKYNLEKVYALDMFPYTYHVECVALLSLRTLEK